MRKNAILVPILEKISIKAITTHKIMNSKMGLGPHIMLLSQNCYEMETIKSIQLPFGNTDLSGHPCLMEASEEELMLCVVAVLKESDINS